jgi:hypothetical protein
VALQSGVGLGLLYNTPPSLSIPCSVSYSFIDAKFGKCILFNPESEILTSISIIVNIYNNYNSQYFGFRIG